MECSAGGTNRKGWLRRFSAGTPDKIRYERPVLSQLKPCELYPEIDLPIEVRCFSCAWPCRCINPQPCSVCILYRLFLLTWTQPSRSIQRGRRGPEPAHPQAGASFLSAQSQP